MKQYITIIAAITTILPTACIEDINYKGPDGDRMLIVNCIAEDGSVPVIKMSNSAFFLDSYYTDNVLNSGIDVNVSINGQMKTASYDDKLKGYVDGRVLNQGDIITVAATHRNYGTVEATDTVPYVQGFTTHGYTKAYVPGKTLREMFGNKNRGYNDSSVDSTWVVDIEIEGHADRPDFYILTIEPTMTWYRYNPMEARYDTIIDSILYKIPARTNILLGKANAATTVLDDAGIDTKLEYGKQFFVFDDLYLKEDNKVSFEMLMQKPDTMAYILHYNKDSVITDTVSFSIAHWIKDKVKYKANIKLYTLSSTYYYYYKSAKDFSSSGMTLMSEPVTIIHNVKGGAGILATYASYSPSISYKYRNWKKRKQ